MDRPRKGQEPKRIPTPKDNYRYLRLMWNENGADYDYTLKYHLSDPGLWILVEQKKGLVGLENGNSIGLLVCVQME